MSGATTGFASTAATDMRAAESGDSVGGSDGCRLEVVGEGDDETVVSEDCFSEVVSAADEVSVSAFLVMVSQASKEIVTTYGTRRQVCGAGMEEEGKDRRPGTSQKAGV